MSDLGSARGRIVIDTSDIRRAQAEVQSASASMTQSLRALGIGFGVREVARFVVEAEDLATAYRRQSVAAVQLAGSQGKLNQLLSVYDEATGGALDKATQLANVTKLMAVGFADSSTELDQFARAIRGISIAMGKPQDFVAQNLILELFSQRGQRLDQIGLQYDAVRQRSEELQAADASLTKQMAYQQAVLEQAAQRYGGLADSAAGAATEVEKLRKAFTDLQLEMGQDNTSIVNAFAKTVNEQMQSVRETVQGLIFDLQNLAKLNTQSGNLGIAGIQDDPRFLTANPIGDFADRADRAFSDWLAHLTGQLTQAQRAFVQSSDARNTQRHAREGLSSGPAAIPGFTPEQRQVIRDDFDARAEIERQANADRLDATRQYEEQRTSTIRQYELTIAREAEDFARGRLRAEEDFQRGLERTQRDSQRRDQRAAEDLARTLGRANQDSIERIADLRKDANKRLAEIDTDFAKEQERRQRDFKDDQLSAAGRLDAIALLELRKDRAKQLRDAKEDHEEQRADLKEQLGERIDEEKEALEERRQQAIDAHERQLQDAKEADAQRLEDMQADFDLRQTREDEDRETRLRRMGEDHQAQLDEMARQLELDLQRIRDDEARKRLEQQEQFNIALNEAGVINDAWIKENNRVTDAAVADYTRATNAAAANAAWLAQIAAGGGVTFPSLANPGMNLVRPIPGPSTLGGRGGSVGGKTVNASITINGDGMNEREVARFIVDYLEAL